MGAGRSKPQQHSFARRARSQGSSDYMSASVTSSNSKGRGTLQHALVREREGKRRQQFEDIYEIMHEIGQGGICKIYKIQKKEEMIGGSSRPGNVQRSGFTITIPSSHHHRQHSSSSSSQNQPVPPSPKRAKPIISPVTGDILPAPVAAPMYFALKVFNLSLIEQEKIDSLRNEVEILKTLDHKNIIKAYEAFTTRKTKKLMLVMELCTGGDMYARIPYTEQQVAITMRQILSAVKYMHASHFIHRDIKMENILWESPHPDAEIKVIDFGLTKEYSPQNNILTERVGTLYSMSPETMKGIYTQQADLWSVAVCAFIMLANGQEKPFEGRTPKEVVAKVLRGDFAFEDSLWKDISAEAKDFIRRMLVVEPSDRPTAGEALQHEWIVKHNLERSMNNVVSASFKSRICESIVEFADMGEFRKLALNVIAKKSSSSEIIALRKVFEEFDTDLTGTITLEEFKNALSSSDYTDEEIMEIFKKVDVNRTNVINYTEFLAATLETQGSIEEYRLAEAFDALDSDDSGYISRENLRNILGERGDDDLIDRLLAEVDTGRDGRISYEEFLQLFSQTKHDNIQSIYAGVSTGRQSDEDLLRKHGILKTIKKTVSSGSLKKFSSFASSGSNK